MILFFKQLFYSFFNTGVGGGSRTLKHSAAFDWTLQTINHLLFGLDRGGSQHLDKFSQLWTKLCDNESQGKTNWIPICPKRQLFIYISLLREGAWRFFKISFHLNSGSTVTRPQNYTNIHPIRSMPRVSQNT